jgi:carboxylate-amine ligase
VGASTDDFTIGVEEEYQIVDPLSGDLRPGARRILQDVKGQLREEVTNELFLSQIEIGTRPVRTLAEVRAELVRLRRAVIAGAAKHGSRIAAAGTHPFSHWEDQEITPKPRYFGIARHYQQLAREQIIYGCHVHVGISDREAAIGVLNRVRPWLPALLALSANSPFWLGVDTGFASYRTEIFGRFPTTGIPQSFKSRSEYDTLIADLVATGLIEDASKIYWDVRPSMHFETLEFRVADVCSTIDEAVMIAGLCRALARTCHAQYLRDEPIPDVRPELILAAKFQAARYGTEGGSPQQKRSNPSIIDQLLTFLRPVLEADGEWDEISGLVRQTLERGTGAARQRQVFAKTGELKDVVHSIARETALGTE